MKFLKRLFNRSDVSLGRRGEREAVRWLKKQGFKIIRSNLVLARNEADVVALDPDQKTVVIVEVKTGSDHNRPPELNLHHEQRTHLARIAARIQRHDKYRDSPFRFDVIGITWPEGEKPEIRHHPAAFESPW